jgi:hypothetical protein
MKRLMWSLVVVLALGIPAWSQTVTVAAAAPLLLSTRE